jgi:Secretion system C-terminal sorting domain
MLMAKHFWVIFLFLLPFIAISQTGPAGISNTDGVSVLQIWLDGWDLDGDGKPEGALESVVSGGLVTGWNNKSGHASRNLTTGTSPTFIAAHSGASNLNGMPTVSFVAGSSHFLQSSGNVQLTPSGNLTLYMVFDDHQFDCDQCPTINWRTTANVGGFTIEGFRNAHKHFAYNGTWNSISVNSTLVGNGNMVTTNPYIYGIQFGGAASGRSYRKNSLTFSTGAGITMTNTLAPYALAKSLDAAAPVGSFTTVKISEVIIYNVVLTNTQKVILENYLAAKYGITLTVNKIYQQDLTANGDFDYQVAGIGALSLVAPDGPVTDAQGDAIVRITAQSSASIAAFDFLFWGHNNLLQRALTTTSLPVGVQARLNRVWRMTETGDGDLGPVDIKWTLTPADFGTVTASDLRLLMDLNNDGDFSNDTPISGATSLGGNVYQFTGITTSALRLDNVRFTLGTINTVQTPLPIALTRFDATLINNRQVQLNWETATEENNDFFTIERSATGKDKDWAAILTVDGAGNSLQAKTYTANDNDPLRGIVYYRLKQTDLDGKETYPSDVVTINNPIHQGESGIHPNPTKSQLIIEDDVIELNDLRMFNMVGEEVSEKLILVSKTERSIELDLSNFAAGIYLIKTRTKTSKVYKY